MAQDGMHDVEVDSVGKLDYGKNSVSGKEVELFFFFFLDINAFQLKTIRNTPIVEQVGFMTYCSEGECILQRTMGCLSKTVLRDLGFGWMILGDIKGVEFFLD